MTLPLAHLGHWLWTFYVVPVLIVVAGILRTQRVQKRREEEEKGHRKPGSRR
jgi:cytochrome c-type biogenesis protein CcmH/NrfF